MMKAPERPTPLIELAREQDPAQVSLLIRSARSAPDEDTPGVTWRIRNTLARRTERRARILRFAAVGAVIFVAGTVVGAVMHPLFRTRPPQTETPTLAPAKVDQHGVRRRTPRPPTAPETSSAPEVREEPVEATIPRADEPQAAPGLPALPTRSKPKSAPIRLAARQPVAETVPPPQPTSPPPQAPPPAATPAPSAAEQALISSALGKLRVTHEPAAALALLDEYRSRFPRGVLAAEATRLRREALLQLGRKAAVLEELEQVPFSDATTGDERVLRGELRAAAGRWQAALADFDAVVGALPSGAEIVDRRMRDRLERALWGRASSRSHLGDDDAVCADLGDYLRRFPRGRFATQAKQLFDKECEP